MTEYPDNQSAISRAWEDTKHFLHNLWGFLLVEVLAMGIGAIIGSILRPENASKLVSAMYPFLGAITGLVVGFVVIFGIKLLQAPYRQRNEARKHLREYEAEPKPNLEVYDSPYTDSRTIWSITQPRKSLGSPLFAHVKLYNNPKVKSPEANARKVFPQITFYDINLKKLLKPGLIRFGDTPQPPHQEHGKSRREYYEVEFNANGNPWELTIALKYREDDDCYAYSDHSYAYSDWRKPEYLLEGNSFYVRVHLSGENAEGDSWFILHNYGADGDLELEATSEPNLDRANCLHE